MRFTALLALLLAVSACKKDKKADEGAGSASGTAKASGSGTASASGSGTETGSGSGSDPGSAAAPPMTGADYVAVVKGLATKMCACPDVACLEVNEAEAKKLEPPASALTVEQEDELAKLDTELTDCALKVAAATPLTGDHAAEGQELVTRLGAMVDEGCKCTDMTCFEAKTEAASEVTAQAEKLYPLDADGHLPPAFEAIMKRAMTCMEQLMPDEPTPD